jgi:hypothetical protein
MPCQTDHSNSAAGKGTDGSTAATSATADEGGHFANTGPPERNHQAVVEPVAKASILRLGYRAGHGSPLR